MQTSAFAAAPWAWLAAGSTLPAIEEMIYRGYAITRLRSRFSLTAAILISCLFFGLLHWGQGPWGILKTALAGGFFAGVYVWRGSLWAPVVGHCLSNLITLLVALSR
jgi:membrane protease YdiL (CAAX protease family)